jgi:GH25 family lysozyme M1 (1,4-beta-N-acetylmuramidase)
MAILGVDVSAYQPVAFPTKGLAFAFVKATEGTSYVNPRYAGQVAHARAAGLVVGHYHFGRPGDGVAQADYFLKHATLKPGDVLAFDWEASGVSQAERDAFIKHVKAKAPGHRVVLYCNTDYWHNHDTENYAGDGLWIADPNHPAGHPHITHPWVIHQYSWAGGIDRNVANFPSVSALKAWAGVPAPAKPAPAKPAPKPVPLPAPTPHPAPVLTLDQRVTALEKAVKALQAKVK